MMGDRYISQNALIKEIAKIHGNLSTKNVGQAIWNTPTADVVEVVRCKDCKHGTFCFDEIKCKVDEEDWGLILYHEPQHFCSYGERREENEG